MGFRGPLSHTLVPVLFTFLLGPPSLRAQEVDRIWGRVQTVSGQIHEGFIRWDRNEGSWVDQLDGSKEHRPFEFQDWWKISHPGDRRRDRVIELAGYRITWDDDEPDFPDTAESGIRFGHIRRLTVVEGEVARLELRSGSVVESGGWSDRSRRGPPGDPDQGRSGGGWWSWSGKSWRWWSSWQRPRPPSRGTGGFMEPWR